ncbi:hypothetical protein [Deinococcus fonticola]|uniref:hypothetical protein n=1 Tax=Deinococcus fonticola TaxID=2528713 RepID=UPI001F0DC1F5|nr:hypothetical protein [Deinococcus fonticola]
MKMSAVLPHVLLTAALILPHTAAAQTLVPFSDPKLPYSFSHPQGWLGVELGDKTSGVSMVSGKTPPATMIRLLYAPKAGGQTLNLTEQFTGYEQGLKSTGVSVRPQSSYPVSYGGLRGMEREYIVSSGKKSIKMRVWFAQGNKNLYYFQLSDTVERYPTSSLLFTKVMRTVRFK